MAPIKSDRQKKPYTVSFDFVVSISLANSPQRPRASDSHWIHDRAPLQTTRAKAPANIAPNAKLIVSNLHYEITPKDLVVSLLLHK